jgi:Ca2+/Na+ antiporter
MTTEIRNVMDFFGWFANKFEWVALWLICADKDGRVKKEDIRRCFVSLLLAFITLFWFFADGRTSFLTDPIFFFFFFFFFGRCVLGRYALLPP